MSTMIQSLILKKIPYLGNKEAQKLGTERRLFSLFKQVQVSKEFHIARAQKRKLMLRFLHQKFN